MNLSIIIPLLNEQESLPELHQWIVKVMTTKNYSYEVIFIDDGSTDESWQIIEKLSKENPKMEINGRGPMVAILLTGQHLQIENEGNKQKLQIKETGYSYLPPKEKYKLKIKSDSPAEVILFEVR